MALPVASEFEETRDHQGAFPRLGDDALAALAEHGTHRAVSAGETLFDDGDTHYDFYVVLSGKVAILQNAGCEDEHTIGVHGERRFLGELNLLTGGAVYLTARVLEDGEVLQVPRKALRELVDSEQSLTDLILRAYLARRALLIGLGAGPRVIGSRYSRDTQRLRVFLARNRFPHGFLDLEEDTGAEALVRHLGLAPDETPVVLHGHEMLRNPSNDELARVLGLRRPSRAESAVAAGGQAGTSTRIENYLGFPGGISGMELAERAILQAGKFGARLLVPVEATQLCVHDDHYRVRLGNEETVEARSVVIATGARYRKLAVDRIEELTGLGVYYAATPMEADMCSGSDVVIVGGGNSAGQAAMFLSRKVHHVTLMVRGPDLARTMSRYLIDQIDRTPNIEVRTQTEVDELVGDRGLEAVIAHDRAAGERTRIDAKALFVFIGADPRTGWLTDEVLLDEKGFVLAGAELASAAPGQGPALPFALETSAPGVFAVGDVRSGSIKRVASAVGEGSMAVRLVHQHLAEL